MKLVYQILATAIVCFLVQIFLPWWTMALVAFAFGYYFNLGSGAAFLAGFVSVGLLWFAKAYSTDLATQSILTEKVNRLLPLNVFVMMVIVGGLVGGFASMTGTIVKGKKQARYY
ncbi:MAG: hypothetical protein JST43_13695 [Bacteroidetes bacterium]|nr:hypothetical protein [Bacteroidota bacterium]MBS1539774.1 hypothetical protein [Bacteroidota bacterium]